MEESIALSRQTAEAIGMRPYYLYRRSTCRAPGERGWALPGRRVLYNIDMMEETHHVLALGAGGVSKRMDFKNSFHARWPIRREFPIISKESTSSSAASGPFSRASIALPRGRSAVRSVRMRDPRQAERHERRETPATRAIGSGRRIKNRLKIDGAEASSCGGMERSVHLSYICYH